MRGAFGAQDGADSVARVLEEVRAAAPDGEEVSRLDALAQRAFLIARAAKKLAAELAPKRKRGPKPGAKYGPRRRQPTPEADLSGWAPLAVLAMALLVPWLHIMSRGKRDLTTGCLTLGAQRYSHAYLGGPPTHRMVVMLMVGSALDGKLACHHCDNKPCVEPTHLYAGTHFDNARDRKRIVSKPTRSDLPRFESWEQWAHEGGWDCTDTPVISDAEGIPGECDVVDLTSAQLARVDRAGMGLFVLAERRPESPDEWTEEDERSLMTLGYLDGQEPREWTRMARDPWTQELRPYLIRRPA